MGDKYTYVGEIYVYTHLYLLDTLSMIDILSSQRIFRNASIKEAG